MFISFGVPIRCSQSFIEKVVFSDFAVVHRITALSTHHRGELKWHITIREDVNAVDDRVGSTI